ncbi:MAG: two-component regulator propeller domain-containing protein, partial [Bacteroidota bacterium]
LYEDHLTNTPTGGSFGIRSILEDRKGKFWFCNSRYRYSIFPGIKNEDGKVLVDYKTEKGIEGIKAKDGTNYIYFLSAVEDNAGDLWMATYDEGVWRYHGKQITRYPVTDGGKPITLFSIYKDRKGQLWLGTHKSGAYAFNGKGFEKFQPGR